MRTSVRRMAGAMAAAVVSSSLLVLAPAPAVAAGTNGGIYAVAPTKSWCPGWRNKVTHVQWSNHTYGGTGGDGGDDIVWMPVRTGSTQSVNISVRCKYSTPIGMNFTIKPTRTKQTFWFYPDGRFTSN